MLAAPTLHASDTLERAADTLVDPALAFVPVIGGDQQLAGIVTRRDVLDAYRSVRAT